MARTSRPVPSAGLHALLFVHDILSDAPTAPASLTTSNASNTVSVSGPPRVLEANKDETPSVVNEGAPEDEHQPPPGTLAADTSEHPESQPEGSHASPPTIISGQSDATQLNPLALKLLYFIRRANGGMGMAEVDINGLLQLVVEPGLAHLVTSELRNSKDLERTSSISSSSKSTSSSSSSTSTSNTSSSSGSPSTSSTSRTSSTSSSSGSTATNTSTCSTSSSSSSTSSSSSSTSTSSTSSSSSSTSSSSSSTSTSSTSSSSSSTSSSSTSTSTSSTSIAPRVPLTKQLWREGLPPRRET
ncbi:unnamed protein product [Closterium sp. NIES-54]